MVILGSNYKNEYFYWMKNPIDEFKRYANLIVGDWYNKEEPEKISFSFSDTIRKSFPLTIEIKGKTIQKEYSLNIDMQHRWYFDINNTGELYITEISPKTMTIETKNGYKRFYIRKIDADFANETLQGFH